MNVFLRAATALFLSVTAGIAQVADYRDVDELTADILALDGALSGRVSVESIGRSEEGRDILAVKLRSAPRTGGFRLVQRKPVFLIECGMHAREWAATETCLRMIEDYVALYPLADLLDFLSPGTILENLPGILDDIDVLVVPLVNPDGRMHDDQDGGNPYAFDTSQFTDGWRKNRGVYPTCDNGIDLARNFSRGWSGGVTNCTASQYRGAFPFEAKENRRLRRLVNNHLVAMSLSVHGNTQGFDWRINDRPGSGLPLPSYFGQTFLDEFNRAHSGDVALTLGNGASGGGLGQFPAWASFASNTPGEADEGTLRAISAFMLEVPIQNADYATSAYQLSSSQNSHGFRPTAQAFLDDMRAPMLAGFLYLARQASNTWRPLDPVTQAPVTQPCSTPTCQFDMALVGSTMVSAQGPIIPVNAEGAFRITANPDVHDYLRPGTYAPVVAVQNSSLNLGTDYTQTLTFRLEQQHATLGWITILPTVSTGGSFQVVGTSSSLTLSPGEISVRNGPRYQVRRNREYRLTISLSGGDAEPRNDQHVYRFRVHN